MGLFDGVKYGLDKAKSGFDAVRNYTDEFKENEAINKSMSAMDMEQRIRFRPEGVKYCLVSGGKILDVYENKVVFTSTKSTSTVVGALFAGKSLTQGEKTIYFKDVIGIQHKASTATDGYIQIETAAGGVSSSLSQYKGENSIQFAGDKCNSEAEIIVQFVRKKIEEIKNAPAGGVVMQTSGADELKKFKELLDMGIITQEEFNMKKKEILGF